MSKKIDRTGEKGVNNFGSEMVIVEYKKARDIAEEELRKRNNSAKIVCANNDNSIFFI